MHNGINPWIHRSLMEDRSFLKEAPTAGPSLGLEPGAVNHERSTIDEFIDWQIQRRSSHPSCGILVACQCAMQLRFRLDESVSVAPRASVPIKIIGNPQGEYLLLDERDQTISVGISVC